MTDFAATTTVGYLLDLAFGDPEWLPHPVRGIGWVITRLEQVLYPLPQRRLTGTYLALSTVGLTCGVVNAAMYVARRCGRRAGLLTVALLTWTTLATRDLAEHAEAVRGALQRSDLPAARSALAHMVSRDTLALDTDAVARGCIESVAENLVDGSVSPLLFAFFGGPVAAFAFKAVSTLDSMVGYKNARYREFGWASARADDVLNWIPARLIFLILPAAAWLCGEDAAGCARSMWFDGSRNPSPNSGIAEAGMAGALGIRLGGENVYAGVTVMKPHLNQRGRPACAADIPRSIRILFVASALTLAATWIMTRGSK